MCHYCGGQRPRRAKWFYTVTYPERMAIYCDTLKGRAGRNTENQQLPYRAKCDRIATKLALHRELLACTGLSYNRHPTTPDCRHLSDVRS
jgi:hypothetical protein